MFKVEHAATGYTVAASGPNRRNFKAKVSKVTQVALLLDHYYGGHMKFMDGCAWCEEGNGSESEFDWERRGRR